jgi:hypothetical protein
VRLGYCGLDKARIPLSGEEERACWERAVAESADEAPPGGRSGAAAAAGANLWGIPALADVPVDRPAPGLGLWTGTEVARSPEPVRNTNKGSLRARPWGQVPGGGKDAAYLRGLRGPRR